MFDEAFELETKFEWQGSQPPETAPPNESVNEPVAAEQNGEAEQNGQAELNGKAVEVQAEPATKLKGTPPAKSKAAQRLPKKG
jgi:hypothetical protein